MKSGGIFFPHISNPSLKPEAKQPEAKKDFSKLLSQELKAVDQAQKEAQKKLQAVATGEDPDLVGLTLQATKAELSFKLLLQVRNKLLDAYEEIMRMQL